MKYQNPNFDKKEYWNRRNNRETVKDEDGKPVKDEKGKKVYENRPLRGQGDKPKPAYYPSNDITISFGANGKLIAMNRAVRRQKTVLPKAKKPKPDRKVRNGKKNTANKGTR